MNKRVESWTVSIPATGTRNLRVCNLSKFCKTLGLEYQAVRSAINSARRLGNNEALVFGKHFKDLGVIKVAWSYSSMTSMLETLGLSKIRPRVETKARKKEAPKKPKLSFSRLKARSREFSGVLG